MSAAPTVAPTTPTQAEIVAQARQTLSARNYAAALSLTDQALSRAPQNSELLQMKSLVLMLKGDLQPAAVAAYSGLSTGVLLNRATLLALAPDEAEYLRQLSALERHAKGAPLNPDLQFLLAYHQLAAGNIAEGRAALLSARARLPNDTLIPVLLSQLPAEPNIAAAPPPPVE
jgi:thioredoxin-like negative regulator of GroEL